MKEFEHVYGELFSDKYEELLHSDPLLLELRKLNILNVQGHARTEANSIFTQPLTDQLAAKLAPALMCSAVWNLSRARELDYAKTDGASASVQADVEARFVKQVSLSIAAVKNVIFASQWGGKGMPKEVDASAVSAASQASIEYKPKFKEAKGPVQRTAKNAAQGATSAARQRTTKAVAAAEKAAAEKAKVAREGKAAGSTGRGESRPRKTPKGVQNSPDPIDHPPKRQTGDRAGRTLGSQLASIDVMGEDAVMAQALDTSATPAMRAAGLAILDARVSKLRGSSAGGFESPQPVKPTEASDKHKELTEEVTRLKAELSEKGRELERMQGELQGVKQDLATAEREKVAAISEKEAGAKELAAEIGRRGAAESMVAQLMAMVQQAMPQRK